jgi:hypothetical protein
MTFPFRYHNYSSNKKYAQSNASEHEVSSFSVNKNSLHHVPFFVFYNCISVDNGIVVKNAAILFDVSKLFLSKYIWAFKVHKSTCYKNSVENGTSLNLDVKKLKDKKAHMDIMMYIVQTTKFLGKLFINNL